MAEKIFISGATGNIGSHLVNVLKQRGVAVRAGGHGEGSRKILESKGVEVVDVDFRNIDSLKRAMMGCGRAFSLSPLTPDLAELGINFINAAKDVGVEYIVRSSAMGADNPQAFALGREHRKVEVALEQSGLAFSIIRPNSFMQNYINYCANSIKSQDTFYLPMGNGKVSVIDARDIAEVAAELLNSSKHIGKAYTLTGPEALSNDSIASLFSQTLGREIIFTNLTEEQAGESMLQIGMPKIIVKWLLELYAINRAGYTADVTSSVRDILGRYPIAFEQFISDHINHFK